MSSAGAIHRLVVYGDACASGTLGIDAKKRMRAAMYASFGEAYAAVGVEPGHVHQEDRGDGILAALRPDVPPTLMVGRWIDTLYESLREHNAGRDPRLRLRVGMNAGLVLDDGEGLVGRAVDLACRLCDSPAAKEVMARADDADLLVVVSGWLYDNVVSEGGRYVEPGHYRPARVRVKETDETAWFHIPRRSAPPLPGGPGGGTAGTRDRAPGAAQAGGGPTTGDGPPPRTTGTPPPGRSYRAGGDLQVFEHNTIRGGFTGIRKDREGGGRA
ncbi:hypothetical protein M4914_20310 [Streptomyces somaliensis DSM 40738]|uniref:Guanylate cyclase domain-containing protein n=1 Tax=Streptomyces somaliensis (strain ATCC 33201 / DSM 40738 / JCM 12659 / KCTC 9044 / NCTC 11332 / NRRL B-12077 / IP 733) TaxID=1134445 RepID=A0AA44IDP1_STRE0|nr:hypothetical protein [Streptomyces somaliensis]MCQ0025047.1 hypothetical protein [Streptomyces somaliensis DSM 40738]NKY14498.1 hypothetical protein [Streptomyces somaliensis DSM 40738]